MELKLEIGRDANVASGIRVPSTCGKVGRKHAFLYWKDGVATLEDNESANGTFVNGRRIAKSRIKETDVVWLGGCGTDADCYQLNVEMVFASCREAEKEQRTDYIKEFAAVKQAFVDYQNELNEIKKRVTVKSQMPMRILSLIPVIAGLIIMFLPGASLQARFIAMSGGSVITGVINLFLLGKNSANEELNEMITELQIKYQSRYCCPKCGQKYPLTMHWKKLEAEGKCPNPKCNAEFVRK
jgi:hypothetical protein